MCAAVERDLLAVLDDIQALQVLAAGQRAHVPARGGDHLRLERLSSQCAECEIVLEQSVYAAVDLELLAVESGCIVRLLLRLFRLSLSLADLGLYLLLRLLVGVLPSRLHAVVGFLLYCLYAVVRVLLYLRLLGFLLLVELLESRFVFSIELLYLCCLSSDQSCFFIGEFLVKLLDLGCVRRLLSFDFLLAELLLVCQVASELYHVV